MPIAAVVFALALTVPGLDAGPLVRVQDRTYTPGYGTTPRGYGEEQNYGRRPEGYGSQPPGYGERPPGYGSAPKAPPPPPKAVAKRPEKVTIPPATPGVTYRYDDTGRFLGAFETIDNTTREYNAGGQVIRTFIREGRRVVVFDADGKVLQHSGGAR